jgi:hypothetical protein
MQKATVMCFHVALIGSSHWWISRKGFERSSCDFFIVCILLRLHANNMVRFPSTQRYYMINQYSDWVLVLHVSGFKRPSPGSNCDQNEMLRSASRAVRPLPLGRFLVLIYIRGWVDPRAISATGRIRSIEKKLNYLFGNRNRDLPACKTVPQPTTLPRASLRKNTMTPKINKRIPAHLTMVATCLCINDYDNSNIHTLRPKPQFVRQYLSVRYSNAFDHLRNNAVEHCFENLSTANS